MSAMVINDEFLAAMKRAAEGMVKECMVVEKEKGLICLECDFKAREYAEKKLNERSDHV